MHFMVLILLFMVGVVLWGFFHSNPRGVPMAQLHALNAAAILLACVAGAYVGAALYADAAQVKADERGMAAYLAIMGGSTAGLILVIVLGLVRNFVIFPPRRRRPDPEA